MISINQFASIVLRVLLFALWTPAVVFAANTSLQQTITGVTWPVFLVSLALTTFSGLTALVLRISNELMKSPEAKLHHPLIFCTAHMFGSWLAGILMFSIAESTGTGGWSQIILLVIGSFGGAKTIEWAAERYFPSLKVKPISIDDPAKPE